MVRKAKVVREGKEPFRWCATSQNPARRAPPSLTCCSRAAWAPTEVGGVRACVPRQRARARSLLPGPRPKWGVCVCVCALLPGPRPKWGVCVCVCL